jgi:uncharacterized protein (DUF4415 family)
MKRTTSSRKLTSKQVQQALSAAPGTVKDADTPYDPGDAAAVANFWKGAIVTHGGGVAAVTAALAARRKPGQRGLGKRPPKVAINIRLSAEVLDAFKSTGDGWQTKVDGALKKWLKEHSPSEA